MTRTFKILIAVTVVAFLVFAFAANTRASVEPQVVRATLDDFNMDLSQFTVAPGKPVTFVVTNEGTLSHQLQVQPFFGASASDVVQGPVIAPGTSRTVQFTLSPGVYRVSCALWDHADRGMVTALAAEATPQKSFPVQMDIIVPLLAFVLGSAYIIGDSLGLRLVRQ